MSRSWEDLGLRRVWLHGADPPALVDLDTGERIPGGAADQADLRITYSDESSCLAEEGLLDLRLLARVIYPREPHHGLTETAARLGYRGHTTDGPILGHVLQSLLHEAMSLDREILSLLQRLVSPPLDGVFRRLGEIPPHGGATGRVQGPEIETEAMEPPRSVEEALRVGGAVAAGMERFETRPGQIIMTRAVATCFAEGGAVLVDAPPGIGKTFAYLVPGLLALHQQAVQRLIVTTRTRQLQEQLFRRDLPYLTARLAPGLPTAMLKGRENYLCLRRWQLLLREVLGTFPGQTKRALSLLVRWRAETDTGDIEENHAFLSDPEARSLWPRLCDSPYSCIGQFCPFADDCFSVQARRRARRARLVVVNHPLLLSDLAVGGVILGKYSHLVVDEAHAMESVARTVLARQVSEPAIAGFVEDLAPGGRRQGWLRRRTLPAAKRATEEAETALRKLGREVRSAFREMEARIPLHARSTFLTLSDLTTRVDGMLFAARGARDALDALLDHVDGDEERRELDGFVRRARRIEDDLTCLSAPPNENTVHWADRSQRRLTLLATPLDIAPMLREGLYPKVEGLVMTSATLALGESFSFFCRSMGLDGTSLPVQPVKADTPFAHQDRMRILVTRDAPPADGDPDLYARFLAELMESLSATVRRKGLALFTSYAMLHRVRGHLGPNTRSLAQGDLSRTALLDQFRNANPSTWLMGTESFWEGVDLPGDELEILIITRLPFPVPADPVFAARCDQISRAGDDPFLELSIPSATMKLRQGIGRLLRTQQDRGVVILTDHRIVSRAYGERIAGALPVRVEPADDVNHLVNDVGRWFGSFSDAL